MAHPASDSYLGVEHMDITALRLIVAAARQCGSMLQWSNREKAAWQELQLREQLERDELVELTPADREEMYVGLGDFDGGSDA